MAHDISNSGQFRSLFQQPPRQGMAQRVHTTHRTILLFNAASCPVPIQNAANRTGFHWSLGRIHRKKNEWRIHIGPSIFDVINDSPTYVFQQRIYRSITRFVLDQLKLISPPFQTVQAQSGNIRDSKAKLYYSQHT